MISKRVKKHLLAASALMLSVMVLFSAIGLTLNVHYCNSSGMMKKSIQPVAMDCGHEDDSCRTNVVDSTGTTACCTTETNSNPEKECCDDFMQYIKLLSEFDLPKVKVMFNTFIQATIKVLEFISPASSADKSAMLEPSDAPPPPLSAGKHFVLACHQLKTEPHLL